MGTKNAARPIRVGFLGTGYIADWHAKALSTVKGTSLVAVCDKDLARARDFGSRYGAAHSYESLEAMLGDKELALDVVHVLLPPDLHARATNTLIEHGLHVMLEKPMAVSVTECESIVEQAAKRGVKVGVNHNFLFSPVYENLRNDLAAGKLGRIDHVTITWNRALDQLLFGPFNIWMLRDPRNIILEIAPHCLAPMLDLAGPLEITNVQATNKIVLPSGKEFYRRWSIGAGTGHAAATVNLSFAMGFTEQLVHVRGSMASATVDIDRGTYLLQQHTRYGMDIDRAKMIRNEGASLSRQGRRSFTEFALSKLKLSQKGSPYGLSIARALQSFYQSLEGSLDSRLSPELGRDVIRLCVEIGEQGVANAAAATDKTEKTPEVQQAVPAPAQSFPEGPAEVLLLGATGFIGQELARQILAAGHKLRVLVRNPGKLPEDLRGPGVEVVTGDLTNPEDLKKSLQGIRVVHHLARANVKTWEEFTEQDIEVTRRIAETCLALGVKRLIYTGTIDSYYAGAKAGTITEATPLDPNIAKRNLYARAKAASEDLLMTMHREKGLPVVIFRPGIVIGRGSTPFHWGVGMWSWNSVCQIWGDGRNPLPLVLVEDVAKALVTAMDTPSIEGESFNLVADTDLTALDYLAALEKHAGGTIQKFRTPPWKFYVADMTKWVVKKMVRHPDKRKPSYGDWESRTQRAHFDCTKARNLLNWRPVCERDEIIRQGIEIPASEFLR